MNATTNSTDLYVDSLHVWNGTAYEEVLGGGVSEGEMDAAIAAAVAPKANTADVNASLALKANTSSVNSSLALKANILEPTLNAPRAVWNFRIFDDGATEVHTFNSVTPSTLRTDFTFTESVTVNKNVTLGNAGRTVDFRNSTIAGLSLPATAITTTSGNVQSSLDSKASVELLNQAIFDLQQADFDNLNTVNASLATKVPVNNPPTKAT